VGARELPTTPTFDLGRVWRALLSGADREQAFRALEVASLLALRRALRNGTVWIDHSLRAKAGVAAVAKAVEAGDLKVDDELHLTPLTAEEEEPQLVKLRAALDHRIGEAQLPDLLLQVDATHFFDSCPSRGLQGGASWLPMAAYLARQESLKITPGQNLTLELRFGVPGTRHSVITGSGWR
jgi:hypothetical protein